jgi:hypothetical protein
MKLRHILSPCFVFGHEAHPVSAVRKGVLVFECRRCHQVIRTPLKQQKLKVKQSTGKIVAISALRSRRS